MHGTGSVKKNWFEQLGALVFLCVKFQILALLLL